MRQREKKKVEKEKNSGELVSRRIKLYLLKLPECKNKTIDYNQYWI